MFDENLRSFVLLFEDNIVDTLRSHNQIKKLKNVHSSNKQEFGRIFRERIEVDPLKFGNGIHVHPLGRNLRIQSKFLDLYRPELIKIFGGWRIEEHSDLGMTVHVMLILQYLRAFYFLVRLTFLAYLTVLILHFFRPIGHLDHDHFKLINLVSPDLFNGSLIVSLLVGIVLASLPKESVSDVPCVGLGFSTTSQGFDRALILLFFEGVDEC